MLAAPKVLVGVDTEDCSSLKEVSLLYDPSMLCEIAKSLAASIDSIHSSGVVLPGSALDGDPFGSSKV